ncbi:hypothetical protein P154DRAFT_580042 [Amniculicola lignicola CBS 123094]|uniref:Uncharacterized protein n=1 Tax=Amniculicola lignicola CBS 123094 TaxID=1392246 RepID=A0A6A5W2Z1_9PLEO|nr:hypothetical protein P154DRAFT_580042 [Amniculicola lignicola CBS 123094]
MSNQSTIPFLQIFATQRLQGSRLFFAAQPACKSYSRPPPSRFLWHSTNQDKQQLSPIIQHEVTAPYINDKDIASKQKEDDRSGLGFGLTGWLAIGAPPVRTTSRPLSGQTSVVSLDSGRNANTSSGCVNPRHAAASSSPTAFGIPVNGGQENEQDMVDTNSVSVLAEMRLVPSSAFPVVHTISGRK